MGGILLPGKQILPVMLNAGGVEVTSGVGVGLGSGDGVMVGVTVGSGEDVFVGDGMMGVS